MPILQPVDLVPEHAFEKIRALVYTVDTDFTCGGVRVDAGMLHTKVIAEYAQHPRLCINILVDAGVRLPVQQCHLAVHVRGFTKQDDQQCFEWVSLLARDAVVKNGTMFMLTLDGFHTAVARVDDDGCLRGVEITAGAMVIERSLSASISSSLMLPLLALPPPAARRVVLVQP
jgi:hypothetical protein